MITAVDLFGRSTLTSFERKKLEAANATAKSIYDKRAQEPYAEHFGEDATLESIEHHLITVLQVKDDIQARIQ